MTATTTDHDAPAVFFTNHAIERLVQRLPQLADEEALAASVARARPVAWKTLAAEAHHCGRPLRWSSDRLYLRDDEAEALYVVLTERGQSHRLVVVTVARSRRPKGFQPLE